MVVTGGVKCRAKSRCQPDDRYPMWNPETDRLAFRKRAESQEITAATMAAGVGWLQGCAVRLRIPISSDNRCVVLTGSQRSFSVGADTQDAAPMTSKKNSTRGKAGLLR